MNQSEKELLSPSKRQKMSPPATPCPETSPFAAASRFADSIRQVHTPSCSTPLTPSLVQRFPNVSPVPPKASVPSKIQPSPAIVVSPALRTSSFPVVPHNAIPVMEKTTADDLNYIKIGTVSPGALGHPWYLVLGIMAKEGFKVDETFLGGLRGLFQIMMACVHDFVMLPVETENSSFPTITSDNDDGNFPTSTAVAFVYFKTRNKRSLANLQTDSSPLAPMPIQTTQSCQYDDNAGYSGPKRVYGTIKVMGNVNMKVMAENLQFDLEGLGLLLQWKYHQSAESSTLSVIPGVSRCF